MKNELMQFPVIKNAVQAQKLRFVSVPLSDIQSEKEEVPKDLNKPKSSIFGIEAGQSRRVEVADIRVDELKHPTGFPSLQRHVFSVRQPSGFFTLSVTNIGEGDLIPLPFETRSNIETTRPIPTISPGMTQKIDLRFDNIQPRIHTVWLQFKGTPDFPVYLFYSAPSSE